MIESKSAVALIKFFTTPSGKAVLKAVKNNNKDVMDLVLKGVGVKNIGQDDYRQLLELTDNFDGIEVPTEEDIYDAQKSLRDKKMGDISTVMMGSPTEWALKAAAVLAGEGLKAGGQMALNNANRMAQAILEGKRMNSDKQNATYGPALHDKANAAWAQNRLRQGENLNAGLSAAGNSIEKLLGMYNMADSASKGMQASTIMGSTPSSMYQWLSSQNARGKKLD